MTNSPSRPRRSVYELAAFLSILPSAARKMQTMLTADGHLRMVISAGCPRTECPYTIISEDRSIPVNILCPAHGRGKVIPSECSLEFWPVEEPSND